MNDIKTLYRDELKLLRESAKTFSNEYPALTASLVRESQDPDVEQILKGVAYLTAQIRREERDEFPTALQSLSQILAPLQMQPQPSGTIMCLTPVSGLPSLVRVERGQYFDSVELMRDSRDQAVACRFSNEWPVELVPLEILSTSTASVESTEMPRQRLFGLKIEFSSARADLSTYNFDKLRLYFDVQEGESAFWQRLMFESLRQCRVTTAQGQEVTLESLVGSPLLDMSENGLQDPQTVLPSRLLGDYISFPEKLNFFDIDFSRWRERSGNGFTLELRFEMPKFAPPALQTGAIRLFCAPARNQFSQIASPLALTGLDAEFDIEVSDTSLSGNTQLEVINITGVESIARGRPKNKKYQNMMMPDSLSPSRSAYYFYRQRGASDGEVISKIGLYGIEPLKSEQEVLRVSTTCCNGSLADIIGPGDVSVKASQSSDLYKFTNLTNATRFEPANLVTDEAWQAISDQSMSATDLSDGNSIRSYLLHHLSSSMSDAPRHKVARHRFSSIESLEVKPIETILHGRAYFGQEFRLTVDSAHFSSANEYFVFGCILNSLFTLKRPLNSVCRTILIDSHSGEETVWLPTKKIL